MLKKVLWLALACAVLLAALAVSRQVRFTGEKTLPPKAPAAEDAAQPAAATPKALEVVPPPPTPEELQMQEDAAATGMTTTEPAPVQPQPDPAPAAPPQATPPKT